jgi:hypothetical protein
MRRLLLISAIPLGGRGSPSWVRRGHRRVVLLALLLFVAAAISGTVERTRAAAAAFDGTCTVSATLVNSCRPWLGAVVGSYPNLPTWTDQVLAHEQRIGRQVDVVHQYHPAGAANAVLTTDERYFIDRGTILYLNWRPANRWSDAAGGNSTINTQIDQMAASIKSVGPRKLMLALGGEPERFVTPGTSNCPYLKGTSGSPADYRAMWENVQNRFAARGVDNVIWVMNYLGYWKWDCLFPELWPGNDRIDWIVWDPYVGPNEHWDDLVSYFYRALETKSDALHAYTSKAWGLAEFGYWYGTNQAEAYRFYDDAKASLDAGKYPRLKLYEPFDTIAAGVDTRISYTTTGVFDATEQAHYNAFANNPLLTSEGGGGPSADYLAACDKSVETGISCFSGTYNGSIWPTWQSADGHSGTHSVQVTNTSGVAGGIGLNVRPVPVTSTTAGLTYGGAVWVKSPQVGTSITLLLRERRPVDGSAPPGGYTTTTWTSTDAGWHLLTTSYLAKENGNTLTYSVYGTGLTTGNWVRADDFILTSTSGP